MEQPSPTEFHLRQFGSSIAQRQEDTSSWNWVFNSARLGSWLRGSDNTLFCSGMPGAGKTMLAATVIDYLLRTSRDDVNVAYLFCNYEMRADQGVADLLAALLEQLVQKRSGLAALGTSSYDEYSKQRGKPSPDDNLGLLRTVCSNITRVYIVVDALDECRAEDNARRRLIDALRELQSTTDVRLMFTSRMIPEISRSFSGDLNLEVRASEEDVRRFVADQIPRLPSYIHLDEHLKNDVVTQIAGATNGMFSLARFHVESLLEHIVNICAGLVKIQKDSSTVHLVHYTAQRYFERAQWEWNPQEQIAAACLTYLCLDEFRSGNCTSDEAFDNRLDENPFFDYSACYWSDHVRPVQSETWPLAFAFLQDEALVDSVTQCVSVPREKYEEYRYSRHFSFTKRTKGLHLTARYGLCYLTENLLKDGSIAADEKDGQGRTPLSHAAAEGHEAVVRLLLERPDVDPDLDADYDRTPLSYSAAGGHEGIVRLLLERGADVDTKHGKGFWRTPLHWAIAEGHEAVTRLLLEFGADVNAEPNFMWNSWTLTHHHVFTALYLAASRGDVAIAQLLLDRGADINADDHIGITALAEAAKHGHEEVVRLLLDRGADADLRSSGRGLTALADAARHGHETTVQMLIDHGAELEATATDLGTALHMAARHGHETVVRLLLDCGANAGAKFPYTGYPAGLFKPDSEFMLRPEDFLGAGASTSWESRHRALKQAASERRKVVVRPQVGRTPLSTAAEGGHEAIVRLLVGRDDVEADAKDENGRTPLWWAAQGVYGKAGHGHEAVVRLLAERDDVETDLRDKDGRTPLSWAASKGYETLARLLAERNDVDPDSQDNDGRTPLSWAASGGHGAVVRLLMARDDVKVDSKDIDDRTPLSWAMSENHEAVVMVLSS